MIEELCRDIMVFDLHSKGYKANYNVEYNFRDNIILSTKESVSYTHLDVYKRQHVHCVIVGFSQVGGNVKKIFSDGRMTLAKNINPYLVDADNVFIVSRKTPISDVPKMYIGLSLIHI